jgi:predicted secreted hydrolase
MLRYILLAVLLLAIVIFGFSLIDTTASGDVTASAVVSGQVENDITGYARAIAPYDWHFPLDFGPHPEYQTEWWYYTGNLADESGRRFGFQLTVFRRAISPTDVASGSEWRVNQVYMAHFTVTDVEANQFYHDVRFSRGGAELAGAIVQPVYRVWLEDWQVIAQAADATLTTLTASMDDVEVDLSLEQTKSPALQGDHGLSAKSDEPGNASYYYSLTRLLTSGTIMIGGQSYTVTGTTWKDHEFSTSALGSDALGWDWFGLQLDDNRELMLGQIRLIGGGRDPLFGGLLVLPDGSTQVLDAADFTLQAIDTWTSPHTGVVYPAGWNISINIGEAEPLDITVTPLISDQELFGAGLVYWEGASRITGDATGYGYVELTGYADAMTGRF